MPRSHHNSATGTTGWRETRGTLWEGTTEFLDGATLGSMKGNQAKVMASQSVGLNVQSTGPEECLSGDFSQDVELGIRVPVTLGPDTLTYI